jgi:hypothetical protein
LAATPRTACRFWQVDPRRGRHGADLV